MAGHIICFVSFRFVSFRFVSFRSVSFRFDLFRFVSICFVSFRFVFCFVSHFTGTLQLLLQSACTSMCRHICDWNIVECDVKGPFTPETRPTPALSRSGKMDGSAMSGPWSGRAYVGLKYSGDWSGPLWEVVVSVISFSTGWKMVGDDPALHRSYVERGYSVVVGGTA